MNLPLRPTQPEQGTIEVLDGGATLIATGGLAADPNDDTTLPGDVSIEMVADSTINGRYSGRVAIDDVGFAIDYFWQVVTPEHIIGYLSSTFSQEGVTCSVYRGFELTYAG